MRRMWLGREVVVAGFPPLAKPLLKTMYIPITNKFSYTNYQVEPGVSGLNKLSYTNYQVEPGVSGLNKLSYTNYQVEPGVSGLNIS